MRYLLIGALAVTLGGCATLGDGSEITTRARQIQQITTTLCRFVPTIQTIATIINKGAGDAIGIANDICAAVTTAPLSDGGTRRAYVQGVRVRGNFVR